MQPSWANITLSQFQDIYRLSLSKDVDDMGRVERAIAILFNKTEREVEDLTIQEFNHYATKCSFLFNQEVPGKPVKYIRVGTRKYAIVYDPKKLLHRQYVEIVKFSEKPVDNMHLIMASLVRPVKFGFIWGKNTVDQHEAIAADMLEVKVCDVYHSCVFFCKLFSSSIEAIKGFLVLEMTRKGMTTDQAEALVVSSLRAMDGFIQPKKPLNLRD